MNKNVRRWSCRTRREAFAWQPSLWWFAPPTLARPLCCTCPCTSACWPPPLPIGQQRASFGVWDATRVERICPWAPCTSTFRRKYTCCNQCPTDGASCWQWWWQSDLKDPSQLQCTSCAPQFPWTRVCPRWRTRELRSSFCLK